MSHYTYFLLFVVEFFLAKIAYRCFFFLNKTDPYMGSRIRTAII